MIHIWEKMYCSQHRIGPCKFIPIGDSHHNALNRKYMQKYKRIFTVVIDSLGAGEMLDAASYGDAGTDTLGHIAVMLEKV